MRRLFPILIALCIALPAQAGGPPYSPYPQTQTNLLYNQLFCDVLASYRDIASQNMNQAWQVLFTRPVDLNRLRDLSRSTTPSSRQRLLADHLLRLHKQKPDKKILLGVIVEVAFAHGMDTLAAYQDKSVVYIYRNGRTQEQPHPDATISASVDKLFQEAQPAVENIKHWPEARLAPPAAGQVRISFLVSDGIYIGQGSMTQLARSPLAGPVLTAATELLFKLTRH